MLVTSHHLTRTRPSVLNDGAGEALRVITGGKLETHSRVPYPGFVVTFTWSWLIWLPLVLAGAGILPLSRDLVIALSTPATILAAFGPAVGALYCLRTRHRPEALQAYLRGLKDFRFGWRAWLIPIVVFGASTWLAWILPELWGAPRLEMLLPSVWVFPPYVLLMILLGGGQEELGWALWHLPLFFIPGTGQMYMHFAGFVLLIIGYSWFYAWVRQTSGKRTLAAMISHGWANAFVPLFPTIVMVEGAAQPRYWLWVSLTFVIGLVTMALRSRKAK